MKKINFYIILTILTISLSACGYKLRGSLDTGNLSEVSILYDTRHEVVDLMINNLESNQIRINLNVESYPMIRVMNLESSKRQLSVNSSGRADEYEITLKLDYIFKLSETDVISGSLSGSASYDFNESQMQGTKEQEIIALNSIHTNLTRKIINKFIRVIKKAQSEIGE